MSNTEIILEAYKLIEKFYARIKQVHERSNLREDKLLLDETHLFELKYGVKIEEIQKTIKEENGTD
jgi:hypothetical protein